MKKQIAIAAASFLIIGLSTISAQAGSARRHTIEGILIGTGVTLLGTAIAHNLSHPAPARVSLRHHRHDCRYDKYHKRHGKGRWEIRRTWVEPIFQTRWYPGHYTRHGRWIPGSHRKFLVAKGHWKKERVWVRLHKRF